MVRLATRMPDQRPPWLLRQRWDRLLFAHWRVDARALARELPDGVEPDVYDGSAWLAVVAFVMVGTRAAAGPPRPALPLIPELNVRTYVRVAGVPGVWFLSLDASSPLFVNVGRSLYGLRYHLAHMAVVAAGERVHYVSERRDAAFAASYGPSGQPTLAERGSLEHFLCERYRLFASRRGRLVTAVVAHEPWRLQRADARVELNRMAPRGLAFDGEPLLHFCAGVDAVISAPEAVTARVAVPRAATVAASRA